MRPVDLLANQSKAEKNGSLLLEKKLLPKSCNERNMFTQTYIAYGTKLRYNFHLGSGEVLNRNRRSRYVIVQGLLVVKAYELDFPYNDAWSISEERRSDMFWPSRSFPH